MDYQKITVIGLGYIGLPTAAVVASKNKKVIGVDINKSIIETINNGKIHIVEPFLATYVSKAVKEEFLIAQSQVEESDVFIIAVPTPFKKSKTKIPEPDISHIEQAIESIASVLKKGNLLILESTSPVGTTEKIAKLISEYRPDLTIPSEGDSGDISIAYCPERVLPGQVIRELEENDRIIGGISNNCSINAKNFYKIFVSGKCHITNARTAEMAKLTENASRDVQIGFANELSIICDKLDINVWKLIELANQHPRVNILEPGPGVGGHCIAVDPWFIVSKNPIESRIIKTAREVNDSKPSWVVEMINLMIKEFLFENSNKELNMVNISFYGLSFKPNIDDLRESPSLSICSEISASHPGNVYAVEPNVKKLESSENFSLISFEDSIEKSDIHVLLVNHDQFYSNKPNSKYIIDTKGVWINE